MTVLPVAHEPMAVSGRAGDPIRAGQALRSSMGPAGAPLVAELDHLLRRDGSGSATTTGRKPLGGPMRAAQPEPVTPNPARSIVAAWALTDSHRQALPSIVLLGATSLPQGTLVGTVHRRATEVRRPANLRRLVTRRPAVGEVPRPGRTQVPAGVMRLRRRTQARAVMVAEPRRRDRTPLPARAIRLRGRMEASAVLVAHLQRPDRTPLPARVIRLHGRMEAGAIRAAHLRRRDRTRLPARAIRLRNLLPVHVDLAEGRATPVDAREETRDPQATGRAGAEVAAGNRSPSHPLTTGHTASPVSLLPNNRHRLMGLARIALS